MIVYLDSSFLAQAYLPDEPGHVAARAVVEDDGFVRVTGTWTRIEVSGALVRAGRAGRVAPVRTLMQLDQDLADDGPIAVLSEPQERVEEIALALVRRHGTRAMDAWHLAAASLILPSVAEPGEEQAFATRDADQAAVAQELGFSVL